MSGYQVMPRLSAEEYADLEQSIKADGVLVPIIVTEGGEIIDGHHRAEIARKLGVHCPEVVKHGDPTELRTFAYSLNLHRRHLTREQKRELIAQSLRQDPALPDLQHAKRTGASDKTVTSVRRELESHSEIPSGGTRINARGQERPASYERPQPMPPSPLDALAEKIRAELEASDDDYREQAAVAPEPSNAVDDYLANLPEDKARGLADSNYRREWAKAIHRAYSIVQYDAERLGRIVDNDEADVIYRFAATAQRFADTVRRSRSGLRVINGGHQ